MTPAQYTRNYLLNSLTKIQLKSFFTVATTHQFVNNCFLLRSSIKTKLSRAKSQSLSLGFYFRAVTFFPIFSYLL